MRTLLNTFVLLFLCGVTYAQTSVTISGTVMDTAQGKPLEKTVAVVSRFSDSVLVAYTRSDKNGLFKMENLPIDTYQVILSHPLFSDQLFFVFASEKNNVFDFGKITLPSKTVSLNEVVVMGYADPVYYKGDTLIYTADSFKVKANATVEDLLRKLPGIKVDGAGKIYSQGKQVDQVLVDGDEFFGTDPTMATRNLNATTIETVQVYEKKNENTADNANETVSVMNLKLKEDAKKGYFGKISGASDFQNFYESDILANRFSNKQKISIFGLGSNTPRSNFNWEDAHKYGLTNEMGSWNDGDEEENYYFYNQDNSNQGLPRNFKGGFYYTDKYGKNTKVSLNYTYLNREITTRKDIGTTYYLADTTYHTQENNDNVSMNESNAINLTLNQQIDSLTKMDLITKFKFVSTNNTILRKTSFFSEDDLLTRQTTIDNSTLSENYDLNNTIRFTRNYMKKDRKTVLSYNYITGDNQSDGFLNSSDDFFDFISVVNKVDQKKINSSNSQTHSVSTTHTEPLSLKIKLEFSYDYTYYLGLQERKTLDYVNGDYSVENQLLSNDFENTRNTNRAGLKFIYETKKTRIAIGSRGRQILAANNNLITGQNISQNVQNILPNFNYRYKFSDNKRVNFRYNTNSRIPDLNKLQPVPDNTNPNMVMIGNPDLLPTYEHSFALTYNWYKPITGSYLWSNVDYRIINNDFASNVVYDSIGRTLTQTVNVNGNSSLYGGVSMGIPLFSKLIQLDPGINISQTKRNNYVNGQKNTTIDNGIRGDFGISLQTEKVNVYASTNYSYNVPSSTFNNQNNTPYTTTTYDLEVNVKLPKKFILSADANYNMNSRRAQGYNVNYLLCNASFGKTFLKNENLIVSVDATDILNQNISASRTVYDNYISDAITNAVGRYILLKVIYKFNSQKTKEEDGF